MDTVNLAIGIVLMAATVMLFRWGVPKANQPSPVPAKWGMATAFPIVLMSLGIIGLILTLKGIFP